MSLDVSIRQIGKQNRDSTVVKDVACRSSGDGRAVTPSSPAPRRVHRPNSSRSGNNRAPRRQRHSHAVRIEPQPTATGIQGGVNRIVAAAPMCIRVPCERPVPVPQQLSIAAVCPTGLARDICRRGESVQAVQADGFATNNSSWQPGSNRLCGRYGTVDPDQLRQAVNHGSQVIEVAQRPNPIKNYGVAAIGAHRNGGTIGGRGAPTSGAGGLESLAHGPEDCRPDRIIC